MTISVQVDFHFTVQQVFGEKSIRVALSPPPTVKSLLDVLCTSRERYAQIFDDSRRLHSDVKVLRNGRNVVFLEGLDTELDNGDKIAIFPQVVGG
jgi:molybdopterin synthase sulfur carrier subunit